MGDRVKDLAEDQVDDIICLSFVHQCCHSFGSFTGGQCSFLLKCDILRTDVGKCLHTFCGSNSDIYLAGNIAPIFTFVCQIGCLSCFLWCWNSHAAFWVWKVCSPSACQSKFCFKSLLWTSPNTFYADLTPVFSPNITSELPQSEF